jgi:hypothetical protein
MYLSKRYGQLPSNFAESSARTPNFWLRVATRKMMKKSGKLVDAKITLIWFLSAETNNILNLAFMHGFIVISQKDNKYVNMNLEHKAEILWYFVIVINVSWKSSINTYVHKFVRILFLQEWRVGR